MRWLVVKLTILAWLMVGLIVALLCSWLVLLPIGRSLIDSGDGDVVRAAAGYIVWAAVVFCLCCCAVGMAVGAKIGRASARKYLRGKPGADGPAGGSADNV